MYTPGNMLCGLLEENQLNVLGEDQAVMIGLNQHVSPLAPLFNSIPQ